MVAVDMVWPDQCNHHGTLFGGAALSMLDRIAFIMGSRILRGSVVTASVAGLNFAAPAPAGQLVECRARVARAGRRSVTVATRLIAEGLLTGERTDCLSGEFVMVRPGGTQSGAAAPEPAPADLFSSPLDEHASPHARATVAEIVFPGHVNHRGVLHGGPAMEWMVKAGFVAATRQSRQTVVMASSERMNFEAPARVGDIVEVSAQVVQVGRRSIQVRARMWAETAETGARRLCTTGNMTYVVLAT
jgi:acyl-CoA hydrolase